MSGDSHPRRRPRRLVSRSGEDDLLHQTPSREDTVQDTKVRQLIRPVRPVNKHSAHLQLRRRGCVAIYPKSRRQTTLSGANDISTSSPSPMLPPHPPRMSDIPTRPYPPILFIAVGNICRLYPKRGEAPPRGAAGAQKHANDGSLRILSSPPSSDQTGLLCAREARVGRF